MSSRPTNVCVVLLDSLNRHMLGCYGGDEFATPNLDRFAREQATRFTRHVTGSLPCMPARHDILVGALDFLWKPWGSIELWEQPVTRCAGGARRHDDARHRPSTPVRDRRGELPHRLRRLGLRPRARGRPVAYLCRPDLDGCSHAARPAGRMVLRADPRLAAARPRLRPVAHVLPRRGGLPRSPDDGRGRPLPARRRTASRPLVPVRGRVRPARAVRHARPVGRSLRRRAVDRRDDHLAAVRGRRDRARPDHRGRRPPHPRQLRQQALHDRPLVRPGARRVRPARPLGRHRAGRRDRPRPLSGRGARRARPVGQAVGAPLRAARAHAAARLLAGCRGGGTCDALTTNVDLFATVADAFSVSRRAPDPRPLARPAPHGRDDIGA